MRNKKLFDNPTGGNCASCHIDQSGADGSHLLFTDFNFQALGVPRNPDLRANADPTYFDMGLCSPQTHRPPTFPQMNFGRLVPLLGAEL